MSKIKKQYEACKKCELNIVETKDLIMALWDAILIAEGGRRADITPVGKTKVAIPSNFQGESIDACMSVLPKRNKPTLKAIG